MKWFSIKNLATDAAEVHIYDRVGSDGVTAKDFCNAFNAINAARIDLRINSTGGEIFDSSAICTAIREHPADVVAHVDGIAASCASWIACSCDSVEMGRSAYLMIHNPMNLAFGTADDFRKQADTLDKMANTIGQIYAGKSGKPLDQVLKAMDAETWFDAQEAKAFGLCDVIKNPSNDEDDDDDFENRLTRGPVNSLAPLLVEKFRNVPERLRRLAVNQASPPRTQKEPSPMLNVTLRDGKHFVNLDGKELEVTLPKADPAPTTGKPTGKSDEEITSIVNSASDKARKEAVEGERKYRDTFDTIVNSAGITGKAADEFRKFYGLPEDQLKFLATNALAARAKPVGEGSGAREGEDPAAETDLSKVEKAAGERFDNEASVRRMYNVFTNDAGRDDYKTGRGRCVAAARRHFLNAQPKK